MSAPAPRAGDSACWNNETPPDNHCYVDDLVIATQDGPPPNRDAAGYAFIGDW